MKRNLIVFCLLILLSAASACSPGIYTRMDSTSPSFGRIYNSMTRTQAERNLNAPIHTIQVDKNHYRVIYEYEMKRDTSEAIQFNILDFVTFGMGSFIYTPVDRFQGTSHLMAVDYERKDIHELDDKVVGINYKLLNNPNAMVWSDKSFFNTQKKDWDEVIRTSSIAITLDPGLSNPYINRAWAYSEKGDYDKAINDSNIALKIDPVNALAFNNRGFALEGKGEIGDAVKSYKKACKLGLQLACENLSRFDEQ